MTYCTCIYIVTTTFVLTCTDGLQCLHQAEDNSLPQQRLQTMHRSWPYEAEWQYCVKVWCRSFSEGVPVHWINWKKTWIGRLSSVTWRIKEMVEEQMNKDDETTATQLHQMLLEQDIVISLCTFLRYRTVLGWTFRGSTYCQLIRHENKVKRLRWAQEHTSEEFSDVIFSDETTVQLENHRRFCCCKEGQWPRPKPR